MIYTRYLKHITLGRILKAGFVLFAFYLLWGCTRPNKLYIVNRYSGIKIEIPPEIVKNQDCVAYKKFIYSIVRPGFVPSDDCPWAKVGKIGYFVINGVKFAIPRDYLWLGSKDPDGITTTLHFMFKYPDFEASSASVDRYSNVKVTMKGWVSDTPYDMALGFYRALKNEDIRNNPLKYIKYDKKVGMNTLIHEDRIVIYFTGDVFKPKEWMYCMPDIDPDSNPQCEGNFIYHGNEVDFLFNRRRLMEHHWEIRKEIKEKLDEFHRNGEKASELKGFEKKVHRKNSKNNN